MQKQTLLGFLALLLSGACASVTLAADNKADDNELAFNGHCRQCHSFAKDDNRLGPSLYAVLGRKAGSEKGFAYSEAVKNSGLTWDEATLDKWISDPNSVVAGNNMGTVFSGVSDASIRAKIIAFLKTKGDTSEKK